MSANRLVLFGTIRVVLPLSLLAATVLRYNALSLVYGLFLLICPLLTTPTTAPITAYSRAYFILLVIVSSVFTVGHAAFQGYLLAANHGNDTEIATFCSNEEIILRSVGFQRLVGVDWSEILRLLAPDVIMTIISALSLAFSLRLQFKPAPSTQTAPTMSRVSRLSYTRKTHRKILRFMELGILLFFLAISSVIHPCVLSSVYFLSFLFLATWVACWRTLGVKFAIYRLVLLVYSGLHLLVLYLYQFQVAQDLISKDGFYARLLGLTAIIKTACSSPSSLLTWPNKLPVYSNPAFILALYWVLACETRYWWSRRGFCEERILIEIPGSRRPSRRRFHGDERQVVENQRLTEQGEPSASSVLARTHSKQVLLTEAEEQPGYDTMGPAATPDGVPLTPETETQEEMTELPPPSEPEEDISTTLLQLRSPLVTIGRFVLDQSYLFTLIAMMAWSITYHCWLTFVYLLSACIIWMVPKPQRVCLPASPVILAYALGLLIIQYIYGFNLNDDELPVVTESGVKLTQIGLKKYESPWKPLAIQLGFTVVFWMNLCQFTLQKGLNNPKPDPATVRLEKVSNGGKKSAALKRLASAIFWKVVARYWILVCVIMFLVLTLQHKVVIYKIVYMVLFLYFAIGFQLFYRCWRLTLFAFWWVVIIYSMIVLCLIYTYQFEDFPAYWHNGTGLSYVFLSDLGLEEYDTAKLFEQLLVPTAFLIIIILQVNYFHPAFMSVSALDRYKDMTQPEFETPESETPPFHHLHRPSHRRFSLTEDAEHFLRFMALNTDRYGRFLAWIVWRVLEVHVFKLVAGATMLVAVFDVSGIGMIFILILVVLMPFRRARRVLSSLVMLWAALAILAKMTYQLRTLDVSYWFSNCSTYDIGKFPFNGTIDTALWVGLQKSDSVGIYIVGLIMLVLALLFESVVRVHQKQLSQSPVFPKPRFDIIFPATTRRHADDGLLACMKFLANYFFYKFGLEVCTIMIAVTAAVRSDSFAVLYALILGLLLLSPRRLCARAWPAFMGLMVIIIILQYATAVGLPPAACIDYPWAGALNNILEQWLHLPDYITPPDTKRMIADFCVLLFVCLQYSVFQVEVGPNLELYGGGDNTVLNGDIDFKSRNPTQDFIKPKKSMLDYVRSVLFMHMFWVTLAAIFITSIQRINLFCLGYMIGCFAILWSGQNLLLQPRTKLLRVWGLLLAYNYLVILCRTFLQLIACVYYQSLHTEYCIVTELFSLVCQANLRITDPGETAKYDCEDPSSSTLFWDVVCLIFIIIQRRAYCTHYFRHVVTEIEVQTLLASDGARLINRRMIQEVIDYKEKEKAHLDRIRRKMDWLKEQQKRNGEDKMFASELHYTVIRSGDYTLFDDPDDEKYWEELIEEKEKKAGALEVIGAAIEGGTKAGLDRAKTPDEPDGPSRRTSVEPKETDDTITDDEEVYSPGIYTKSKNILILCWTVVFRCLESMLEFLLSISEEYRTMADILDKEKIRMKREIRERAGEVIEDPDPPPQPVVPPVEESAVTIEIEDLPAIDEPSSTAISHTSPSESAMDIKSDATTAPPLTDDADQVDDQDASQSSFFTRLISAVYYVIVSHSEVVCFFLLILDHMMSASALSLWLPISIFLWALLSVPRPTRTYWIVMITYLEAILILKFFFQFQFLPWNQAETRAVNANDPFWFPRIVGFALRPDFASYDLACLLAIFLHRSILKGFEVPETELKIPKPSGRRSVKKRYGLWSDFHESEEDEEKEKESVEGEEEAAAPPPVPEAKKAKPEPELSEDAVTLSEPYEQLPPAEDQGTKGAARDLVCGPFRQFYRAMTANKYLKHTDVYTSMFFCDIITFLIVVFGYSYFGPASAGDEGNVTSYLTENRIPGPFLAMLLIQFCFIVIDRALYLKKCVVGKLVFQIILVIGVHVWIFFLLPYITQRKFVDNLAAKLWYFVKCIYFGFSAYQITCGYPTQILGNILTRGYSIANKFAFKIFLGIPFLLELRSLMDWIWTQTSLDLLCWLTVEEIYANVFLVKCERKIEEAYPTPRGKPRGSLMKYLVGGSQLLLIIFLIWFPLLLFSFAFVISAPFPPFDCTVEISIGGYQPLFKMSAQVQSIMPVPEEDFSQLRSSYSNGGKYQKVIGFMNNYESVDVRRIEVSGKSTSVWGISPPSQKQLHEILLNDTSDINMYFHISFLRDAAGKESAGVAQQTLTYPLKYQSKVRDDLGHMVLSPNLTYVLIPKLFPRFFRVYADGKVKPVQPMTDGSVIGYSNVTLLLKSGNLTGFTSQQEWIQVHEQVRGTVLEPDSTKNFESLKYLTIFAFNDRAAPAVLSFIPGTGTIIGIYISFILVLGKVIRTMFTGLMSDIKYRQMPYVERIQELIYNLYLARESMDLRLEEELFAKLLFVYRSPETMIKYSQYPKNKED